MLQAWDRGALDVAGSELEQDFPLFLVDLLNEPTMPLALQVIPQLGYGQLRVLSYQREDPLLQRIRLFGTPCDASLLTADFAQDFSLKITPPRFSILQSFLEKLLVIEGDPPS